jgi:hypothetical protein
MNHWRQSLKLILMRNLLLPAAVHMWLLLLLLLFYWWTALLDCPILTFWEELLLKYRFCLPYIKFVWNKFNLKISHFHHIPSYWLINNITHTICRYVYNLSLYKIKHLRQFIGYHHQMEIKMWVLFSCL